MVTTDMIIKPSLRRRDRWACLLLCRSGIVHSDSWGWWSWWCRWWWSWSWSLCNNENLSPSSFFHHHHHNLYLLHSPPYDHWPAQTQSWTQHLPLKIVFNSARNFHNLEDHQTAITILRWIHYFMAADSYWRCPWEYHATLYLQAICSSKLYVAKIQNHT